MLQTGGEWAFGRGADGYRRRVFHDLEYRPAQFRSRVYPRPQLHIPFTRWSPMDALALGQTKPYSARLPLPFRRAMVGRGLNKVQCPPSIRPATTAVHLQHRVFRSLLRDIHRYSIRLRDVGPCDAVQAEQDIQNLDSMQTNALDISTDASPPATARPTKP